MFNKKFLALSLLSTSLISLPVIANGSAPNWNYLQVSFVSVDTDVDRKTYNGEKADFDGFKIEGSYALGEFSLIKGSYQSLRDRFNNGFGFDVDVEANSFSIALGVRMPLSDSTELFGFVSYENLRGIVKHYYSYDEDGHGLELGIRSKISDRFELEAAIDYINFSQINWDSETEYSIVGLYSITKQIQGGIGYEISDDKDSLNISLRYNF